MKEERLVKNARCWIPTCGAAVTHILWEKSYGEIIGFCTKHRPSLISRVVESFASAAPSIPEGTESESPAPTKEG